MQESFIFFMLSSYFQTLLNACMRRFKESLKALDYLKLLIDRNFPILKRRGRRLFVGEPFFLLVSKNGVSKIYSL
jgi:hypothetical protein